MLRSSQDENLKRGISELTTEQRLVNVLFDEVKLKSTLHLTLGHILGYADNASDQLATLREPSKLLLTEEGHVSSFV